GAALYQENCAGKFARLRFDNSRRKYSGRELLAGLSRGGALRRRVRLSSLQQTADRNRPSATARHGGVLFEWGVAAVEIEREEKRPSCLHRCRSRIVIFCGRASPARIFHDCF